MACYLHLSAQVLQEEILPAVNVAHAQIPNDPVKRWETVIPVVTELKAKAKKLGLWNLFLSKAHYPEFGVPLTNLEVRSTPQVDVLEIDHVPLLFSTQ